jgi:chromosome segregation ATPase
MQRPVATPPPARPATLPPPTTIPPPISGADADSELALRRQLSRLQHQLAQAQRELANKDEELARAVEKRLEVQSQYDVIAEEQRQTRVLVDEAIADRTRIAGVEQRLQEALAAADEMRHQLEREKTERATTAAQLEETQASFERARNQWREEASAIDEQHVAQIAQLEQQKKAALDAAEAAMKTALERQREAGEAELQALQASHERTLAVVSGELEPKVAEARNLSAEIERLSSELQAQAAEHQNLLAERVELHQWEQQQVAEAHAAAIEKLNRNHSIEMTRLSEEVLAANEAGQLIERNAKLREELWEQTVNALRDSQRKLQTEIGEVKERASQSDANKWSLEQRLITALQENEAAAVEIRQLKDALEASEREARRNSLDRHRFAAFLEEGLALLGALPPSVESEPLDEPLTHDPVPQGTRATQAYAAIEPDLEARLAAESARASSAELMPEADVEPEAEPLPDPTKPGAEPKLP